MFNIIEGLPDNVLCVSSEGKITGTNYKNVLIPGLEKKLKEHKKIGMVYDLGSSFTGIDLSEMLDEVLGTGVICCHGNFAYLRRLNWKKKRSELLIISLIQDSNNFFNKIIAVMM